MKYLLTISFLLTCVALYCQQKGATPLNTQNSTLKTGQTYAVVVGISDYQDEGIPDLRFADRDALANTCRSGKLSGINLAEISTRIGRVDEKVFS